MNFVLLTTYLLIATIIVAIFIKRRSGSEFLFFLINSIGLLLAAASSLLAYLFAKEPRTFGLYFSIVLFIQSIIGFGIMVVKWRKEAFERRIWSSVINDAWNLREEHLKEKKTPSDQQGP